MPVSTDLIVKTLVQHRSQLIGYAWVVVGDSQTAEDVFQDVSLAVVKKADQIQDELHLIRWLRHAIRLRGLELRRKRSGKAMTLSPDVLDLIEGARSSMIATEESERMEALSSCIGQLGETAREMLKMRYGQDLKPSEISDRTGRSLAAIYKSITRIHAALRDCVQRRLDSAKGRA